MESVESCGPPGSTAAWLSVMNDAFKCSPSIVGAHQELRHRWPLCCSERQLKGFFLAGVADQMSSHAFIDGPRDGRNPVRKSNLDVLESRTHHLEGDRACRVEDSVPVGVQEVLRGHAVRGSSINGDDQRLGDYWWLWAERGRWEAERPGRRLGRQEGACSPLSNSPLGLTCRFRKHSHF